MITGYLHTVQLSVLVKAIGVGYAIGLLFAFCMVFNAFNGKNTILVFIRDILFFAVAAVLSFLFSLKYNAGIMRFYIVAGEIIGFLLFYIFPGTAFGNFCRDAAKRIKSLILKLRTKIQKIKAGFAAVFGKIRSKITAKAEIRKNKLSSKKKKKIIPEKKKNNKKYLFLQKRKKQRKNQRKKVKR